MNKASESWTRCEVEQVVVTRSDHDLGKRYTILFVTPFFKIHNSKKKKKMYTYLLSSKRTLTILVWWALTQLIEQTHPNHFSLVGLRP